MYLVATTSICSQHHLFIIIIILLNCVFGMGPWILAVGAWVPVSQLAEEEVTAFRQLEEDKIGKFLDDLLDICKSQKVDTILNFDPLPNLSMSTRACLLSSLSIRRVSSD